MITVLLHRFPSDPPPGQQMLQQFIRIIINGQEGAQLIEIVILGNALLICEFLKR